MSTPAKLVPEGAFGGSAAADVSTSTPDSDASEAVAAALAEAGVDRESVEGSADTVILPAPRGDAPADDKSTVAPAKPAAVGKPADKTTKPDATATAGGTAKPGAGAEAEIDLDAETLAVIEKHPEMRRAYKTVIRGMNKKFEELANFRKTNEADLGIVAAIRKDPALGLRTLAAATGIQITIGGAAATGAPAAPAAAPKTPLAVAEAALGKIFPPEGASALAPALIEIARAVAAGELQPLREALQEGQRELATHRQSRMQTDLDAALGVYGRTVEARGDDWNNDVQLEMSKLVGQIIPGKRADGSIVPLAEYLDVLYNHVAGVRSRESVKTRQLARLRAAVDASEPAPVRTASTRAADQRITSDMSDEDATALAIQQSLDELQGR